MTEKKFCIKKEYIRKIVSGKGACFATDRIMVDGMRVGYMYREMPDNEYDSGWRFMCGDESEAYMDNPDNMGVYDVNTLANYDYEIVVHLEAPIGSKFSRDNPLRKLMMENSG